MPGRPGPPTAGGLRVARQDTVDEGAGGASRSGVDAEAGGLVEHREVAVLVQQADLVRLRLECLAILFVGGEDGEDLAAAERVRGLQDRAGAERAALANPALYLIARPLEGARQKAVEALAGRRGRHLDLQLARGSGSRRGHRLSSAISTRPTVMALSATLKDGQWWVRQ